MKKSFIKSTWKNFINSGTTEQTPPELAIRIRAANVLNLLMFLMTLGYVNPEAGWATLSTVALLFLYIGAFLLTRTGRHQWGRTLTLVSGGSLGFAPMLIYVEPTPNELVGYFKISLATWLAFSATLFTARETRWRVLTTAPILVLLFGFEPLDDAMQWVDYPEVFAELKKIVEPTKLLILINAFIIMFLYIPYIQKADEKRIWQLYDEEQQKSRQMAEAETQLRKALAEAEEAKRAAEAASIEVEASRAELEKRNQALNDAKKELEYSLSLSRRDREDLKRRENIESGVAKLNSLLHLKEGTEIREWGEHLLQTLVPSVGGETGGLYLTEEAGDKKMLVFGAGYAVADLSKIGMAVPFGQGMTGEAALSGRKFLISNSENLHLRLRTGVSSLPVHSLLVLPLVYNEKVEGVLEIASLRAFSEAHLEILDRFAPNLAVALLNIRNRKNIRRLLEEAQSRAEQLAAQEEELRQNLEELAATQEEMQRIQDSLRLQSARITTVIDNTPELIYAIDHDYRLTMFNRTFANVILDGYGRMPEVGESVFEFIYEENRPTRKAEYDRAFNGESFVRESMILEENGAEYYENAFTPIRDENGGVVGVSVFRRDVTQRVRAEQEMENSRIQLQNLNRELEERVESRTRALRQTLDNLHESEKRLSTIIEQFPLGFALFSPNGDLLLTNPAYFAITGRRLIEGYNIFQDPDENRRDVYLREAFSGNAVEMPVIPYRRGRDVVMLKTFAFPITDENNELKQVVFLYDDVSEEWTAANDVKNSESRFRHVVEHFPLAMRFYKPNGEPLSDNPAYTRFWENRRPEYFGVNLQDDPVWAANGLSLEPLFDGKACEFPPIPYPLAEETIWVKSYLFPLFAQDGRIREIILVQQDVTDVKRAEEAYAQANAALRATLAEMEGMRGRLMRSDKMVMLGQMTAGVVHEINSPLSAVSASVEVAAERYVENMRRIPEIWNDIDEHRDVFVSLMERALNAPPYVTGREERTMRKNIAAAFEQAAITPNDEIVRKFQEIGLSPSDLPDLSPFVSAPEALRRLDWLAAVAAVKRNLDNARTAAEKARTLAVSIKRYTHATDVPVAETFDLAENLKDVVNIYAFKLKSLDLEVELNSAIVESGYAGELSQVWTNLIANALQAMENIENPRLTLTLKSDGQTAEVTVADNGPGVPPEIQTQIFDPFFTTKKQGEGTGLGLSLCKRIIERHGGTLSLYSIPGETRFVARLPLNYRARPETAWQQE